MVWAGFKSKNQSSQLWKGGHAQERGILPPGEPSGDLNGVKSDLLALCIENEASHARNSSAKGVKVLYGVVMLFAKARLGDAECKNGQSNQGLKRFHGLEHAMARPRTFRSAAVL